MELISREEVARLIYEEYAVPPKCCKEILDLPTIESRPKGKWIQRAPDEWYCSNCGDRALYYFGKPFGKYEVFQVKSEFCPRCGADMRGEE